jgi:NADPH:quinone reductase-like Zn-dependent oxidoreductase
MNTDKSYMKAVVCTRYGPPEVLQVTTLERPVPGNKEVLIKVHATTVAIADYRIRSFTIPPSFWIPARLALGLTKPRRPILGVELAGEVEAIGKDVTKFKKGDAVFASTLRDFGAYAEYKCVNENNAIALKPAGTSFGEAAAIPIGGRTALFALRKAGVMRGQKVFIYGASGSVGTYAIQIAKHMGADVTAVCSSSNAPLVKSLGADTVLDYAAPDFHRKLGKYDVVFVAIDKLPFSTCLSILTDEGVYLNITEPLKSLPMIWASITTKKKIYVGIDPPESAEHLDDLKKLVEHGVVKPVIDRRYPLAQIVEAHRYVDTGRKKGNVIIDILI